MPNRSTRTSISKSRKKQPCKKHVPNIPSHASLPNIQLSQRFAIDEIGFPYYAPQEQLPALIPTVSEIESSEEVLLDKIAHRVVAVGKFFVVKFGVQVDLEEGRTMMFVKERTKVPVPRVYALFKDVETEKSYIVMERVDGLNLDKKWTSLSASDKQIIGEQLAECLEELSRLPSPGTYSSIGGKPLRDSLLSTDRILVSQEDVNDILIQKCTSSDALRGKAPYYRRHTPNIFRGHPAVFTHGDIQGKNIIVRSDSTIFIIDWATAGWYPSFWEYCQALSACRFQDDWHDWVDRYMTPRPSELAWFRFMTSEMWG